MSALLSTSEVKRRRAHLVLGWGTHLGTPQGAVGFLSTISQVTFLQNPGGILDTHPKEASAALTTRESDDLQ